MVFKFELIIYISCMKSLLKFSLLTLFVFIYSCNTESVISDDELIELIINSKDKVSIAESVLPSISLNYLDKEFEDNYVDQSKLAPKYGYEIALRSMSPFELGVEKGAVYFDLNGRKLGRSKDKGKKRMIEGRKEGRKMSSASRKEKKHEHKGRFRKGERLCPM